MAEMKVQGRRISKKDWDFVVSHIKTEHQRRKGSQFRKDAETIWKEVDRQVAMKSMSRSKKNKDGVRKQSWRSALELGDLSTASEIITADIRRLGFPENWFEAHAKIKGKMDPETGEEVVDPEVRDDKNNSLRALMIQQHNDFGFLSRQELSVKEALHHGGYCVEVGVENLLGAQGAMVKGTKAPVWIPHSMWNTYPDDSKSAMASNLFYTGNMIICSYQKYSALQKMQGENWNKANIRRLDKDDKDKDIELITWHGDIFMPRKGKDVYIPNVKVTIAQDYVIYYEVNPLPYSRIIYNGYERLDVRNPYYVSPLTKMSPTQKIASTLTNKYIDAIELEIEPPAVYDGNDSDLVAAGGPRMEPGLNTPTKNLANFKIVDVANSSPALEGVMFHKQELQKGTGVDSIRSGMSSSTEQTATEVERTHQGGQIRTIDFLDKHEKQGLRPWLYLQHEMNKVALKDYEYYNPEAMAPDFEIVSKGDLPKYVHFEVVGSKGLLEAEQRSVKTMGAVKFLVEIGRGKDLNFPVLEKQFFADAGNKNPGRFLLNSDRESMARNLQEAEGQLDEAMQQVEQLQQENQSLKNQEMSRAEDAKVKGQIEGAKAVNEETQIQMKHKADMAKVEGELEILQEKTDRELALKEKQMDLFHEETMFKDFVSGMAPQEEPEEEGPTDSDILIEKFESTVKAFLEQYGQTKVVIPERNDRGFIEQAVIKTEKPKLDS